MLVSSTHTNRKGHSSTVCIMTSQDMPLDSLLNPALSFDSVRELLSGMPEPVLLLNQSEQVILANDSAETLFGEIIEGTPLVRIVRWPEVLSITNAALNGKQTGEAVFQTTDSAQTTYRVVVHPITLSDDGIGPAAILSLRDVSHIEEAERMRSDFVANVSHELRSPLTALSGFIETLKGPASKDDEARDKFLDIMEREAARMERLIDDLLSLSKIEVNRHIRPGEEVDLTNLICDVRDSIRATRISSFKLSKTSWKTRSNTLVKNLYTLSKHCSTRHRVFWAKRCGLML